MKLDEVGINDVIVLFNEKNQHVKDANLNELVRLKNSYPELFNKEKESEVYELLDTIDFLKTTPYFKSILNKESKKKFISLDHHEWRKGNLDRVISQYTIIRSADMDIVAREMVKEAVAGCWDILCHQEIKPVPVYDVFPFLGFLLHELICKFSPEKQQKMLERAIYKMRGQEQQSVISEEKNIMCKTEIYNLEQKIKDYFHNTVEIIFQKTNQREDYYSDAVFFCLMEAAEFIGLLIPNIGISELGNKNDVINSIQKNIR